MTSRSEKQPLSGQEQLQASALGKSTTYALHYDPGLLYGIARAPQRKLLGLTTGLNFSGADFWTAYELSWLNARGKPEVAIAHIMVPCESPNIIESKSLKLYLLSYSSSRFAAAKEVETRIQQDLNQVAWAGGPVQSSVHVKLLRPPEFEQWRPRALEGLDLDRLDIACEPQTGPMPQFLTAALDEQPVQEALSSRLLKSNCPVTGQPDWGSVQIAYEGPQINQGGLLRYIISFREHDEFHEHCAERMFTDIWQRCKPSRLSVFARYTRRGGIDINPYRTSHPGAMPKNIRTHRQ